MNVDRLYPIIALAMLAAVTIWLERLTRAPEEVQRIERTDPDFIGESVRVVSFDQAGKLSYELDAERITHFPASDVTEFAKPNFRYHSANGLTTAVAQHGETTSKSEVVELRGKVVVRSSSRGSDDVTIESETLTLRPDSQQASTDSPVVLKRGNITAHGDGMRADNIAGTLDLVGAARVQLPSSPRNRP